MADYTNLGMGPGTVTIDTNDYHIKAPPSVTCEIETGFATVDQLSAPYYARLINKQFGISGSLAEISDSICDTVWDGWGKADDTATTVAVIATFANGTFTMTTGIATDGGSMDGDTSDAVAFTWAFKSYDTSGSTDQVSIT